MMLLYNYVILESFIKSWLLKLRFLVMFESLHCHKDKCVLPPKCEHVEIGKHNGITYPCEHEIMKPIVTSIDMRYHVGLFHLSVMAEPLPQFPPRLLGHYTLICALESKSLC